MLEWASTYEGLVRTRHIRHMRPAATCRHQCAACCWWPDSRHHACSDRRPRCCRRPPRRTYRRCRWSRPPPAPHRMKDTPTRRRWPARTKPRPGGDGAAASRLPSRCPDPPDSHPPECGPTTVTWQIHYSYLSFVSSVFSSSINDRGARKSGPVKSHAPRGSRRTARPETRLRPSLHDSCVKYLRHTTRRKSPQVVMFVCHRETLS